MGEGWEAPTRKVGTVKQCEVWLDQEPEACTRKATGLGVTRGAEVIRVCPDHFFDLITRYPEDPISLLWCATTLDEKQEAEVLRDVGFWLGMAEAALANG